MPKADAQQNAGVFSPRSIGPQVVCSPTLGVPIPTTIGAGANWNPGVIIADGWKSIAVGATLSQAGTITIQRYLDDAAQVPVGAAITATLVAATANWATVNDGIVFASFTVIIANTSGSVGNLTKTAVLLGAS